MSSQPLSLGKYEILSELGRGGFGVVYRAVDTRLNRRPVALKVLAPHLLFDPLAIARFQQEAGFAANLQHPNIVTIYDIGEEQGQYYLAMQLIDGKSLADILQAGGTLAPERVNHIVRQLADALDFAHAHGVLHRDIKPSNILLDAHDHVTLTDFGLARAVETSAMTSSGKLVGTPTYMAPELLDAVAANPATRLTDIYALGIATYEMLAGRPPFIGNPTAIALGHLHTPPPPITQFNPRISAILSQVVSHALAKDPVARYQSAHALNDAVAYALITEERERLDAQERERRKIQEEIRREAELKAQREREEHAKREVEEKAKRDAEQKCLAEEKARREAEQRAHERAELEQRLRQEMQRRTAWIVGSGIVVAAIGALVIGIVIGLFSGLPMGISMRTPTVTPPPTLDSAWIVFEKWLKTPNQPSSSYGYQVELWLTRLLCFGVPDENVIPWMPS